MIFLQIFHISTHYANIYNYMIRWCVSFTSIQYCSSYQNHKIYSHVMISSEHLPFCAADSNKYIGFINPHVYGSSFFSHIHIWYHRLPFLPESYVFTEYLNQLLFYHHILIAWSPWIRFDERRGLSLKMSVYSGCHLHRKVILSSQICLTTGGTYMWGAVHWKRKKTA